MGKVILLKISDRNEDSIKLQEILTKYGCDIKTRIGLHQSENNQCSKSGLIILDVTEDSKELTHELETNWETKIVNY